MSGATNTGYKYSLRDNVVDINVSVMRSRQ